MKRWKPNGREGCARNGAIDVGYLKQKPAIPQGFDEFFVLQFWASKNHQFVGLKLTRVKNPCFFLAIYRGEIYNSIYTDLA